MKKKNVFLIAMLLLSFGCSSLPTVKEAANQLETIPLNTSLKEIKDKYSELQFSKSDQPVSVRSYIDGMIILNPLSKELSSLEFYRQWPEGILLNLSSTDLFIPLKVQDSSFTDGEVLVFLSKDMKYKGYYANSFKSYSADSENRLEAEKNSYINFGFPEESALAKIRIEFMQKGGINIDEYFPLLPLSKNREKNKAKIESLMKEIKEKDQNYPPAIDN